MGRLISEDDVMRMLTSVELNNGTITDAKSELRNVKTAYDVDAVVKETRKKLDKILHICALEDVDEVYHFYDSLEKSIRKGCGMRTIAEVVEDIKNGTWGSDIEYQSECEKLHKLCDEILEIEKAKMEKVIAELEEETECPNCSMYCADAHICGFDEMRKQAIEIVKRGGVE